MSAAKYACYSTSAAALLIGAWCAPPASAQEDETSVRRLEAVTVSATKREATLQDIPVAVTVTDAETIDRAAIMTISDLQTVVPSLRVQQRQNAVATNFYIRGFGNGGSALGIEPSVGVFIDGVYRSRSGSAISDLPNIERIEVLRGPQSTLFGKNASAGVISVVTKKPTYAFGGHAELTAGSFDQRLARGYVNIPIAEDKLAVALSGQIHKRDGFVTNLYDGNDLHNINRWAIGADVLYEPAANTSFRLLFDHDKVDEDCCSGPNLVDGLGNTVIRALGGNAVGAQPFSYEVYSDLTPFQDVTNTGASLQADIAFDGFSFTSLTAYRENDVHSSVDTDFSSAGVFGYSPREHGNETFTQELRLASTGEGRLDWMAGAFFFDETIHEDARVVWGPDGRNYFQTFLNIAFGGALPATIVSDVEADLGLPAGTFFAINAGSYETFNQDNQSVSLFGQLDYHLTDRLTATGGLSVLRDEKTVTLSSTGVDPWSTADLSQLSPALLPYGPFLAATQFLPELVALPNGGEDNTSKDEKLTWAARLAYDLNDNINVYVSASTGFKASSWVLNRDTRPVNRLARPENTLLYEAGFKGQWDRFGLNLTAFDQTIEDFQTTIFTGTAFAFRNAEEQSTTGVEVEATWLPADPLTLTFAATLLDPVYDSYTNANINNVPTDLSGKKPAGIPETSISTSATYEFALGAGTHGFLRADYAYESEVQVEDNVSPDITREVNVVNASAGLAFDNGWSAQVWGRNIFDDEQIVGAFPPAVQFDNINAFINTPATYGITVRRQF